MQRLKIRASQVSSVGLGAPNPKIQTIRFYNITKNWLFKVYPEGETPLWDCRTSGTDKCVIEMVFKNMGDAGHVYAAVLIDGAAYWDWEGDFGAGEQKTFTYTTWSTYYGFFRFKVKCMDASVSPFRETDAYSFTPNPLVGFRVFAYEDSNRVSATAKIVETGQTFLVDTTTENIVHVGIENRGKTYTIECTRGKTLSQTAKADYTLPRLDFYFGVAPTYPNIRIDKIVFWDTPDGAQTSYKVFPEGDTPLFSAAGATFVDVTVTNTGGDGNCGITYQGSSVIEAIKSGETKTLRSVPIGSPHYDNILHCIVIAGYAIEWTIKETDRHVFDAYRSLPITTYPSPNPDEWSDTILALEGSWQEDPFKPIIVKVDPDRVYGTYSIRYDSGKKENFGKCTFTLGSGYEANLNSFPWMHIMLKLGENCVSPFRIILEDIAGQKLWFGSLAHLNTWDIFMLPVGDENDALWNKDPKNTQAVQWTKIKKISIEAEFNPNTIGTYRIDNMHFTTVVPGRRTIFVFAYTIEEGVIKALPNINVVHGLFVGIDPSTGQEKYFWDYDHMKKTDSAGKTNFPELYPLVYGLRLEDSTKKYKSVEVRRIDTRDSDQTVSAQLELAPTPKDYLIPLIIVTVTMGTIVVVVSNA